MRKSRLFTNLTLFLFVVSLLVPFKDTLANGCIIPTDQSQDDFLKAYKFALYRSYADYWFTNTTLDDNMFPRWGEFSIYWVKEGPNKGSFIYPDKLPSAYSSVTSNEYDLYEWDQNDHYSLQYKINSKRVLIFKSKIKRNDKTVSWESVYFKNLFDTYLYSNTYSFIDEDDITTDPIISSTQLLIIPSFTMNGTDNKYYIDSVFRLVPNMKSRLDAFLAAGGTIYAEGNAVYFVEKLGYLSSGAVEFDNNRLPDPYTGMIKIDYTNSDIPLNFTEDAGVDSLYCSAIPMVNTGNAETCAEITGFSPAAFVLNGNQANGGRIICNTGLPTIGGINGISSGSRQLQWTLNSIFYAFTNDIDVTRSIYNDIPDDLTAGRNAISYDRVDTFEVRVLVRNLSSSSVSGIEINEIFRNYFKFVDVITSGVNYTINGTKLVFNDLSMPANSEREIVYRLRTPDSDDKIHEEVDKYISWRNYIYTSYNITDYEDSHGKHHYWKYRNYTDVMFSARLVADTDLNWKNFLGLYYQPFKVFMIMENKERTSAENTKYVQYIPKDVPFYWSDKTIDIPILKTPGGKYVDVLRGSNDEDVPEFDMDHDGHPDVWLDTASIYPKGYTITEEEVYWLNPWEHLRSGDTLLYEDIDHDGINAKDLDGDGVVDIDEPGDKIRVWKVTWDIGRVPGYDYSDPYSYYEIWVDPPDLVKMAAGVGEAYDLMNEDINNMFYPYSPDLENPNLADTSWKHWMERDSDGEVKWKQLIFQKINNYEGFTFIDTLNSNYRLLATDRCAGTVPQPHREFIAVLSLGGKEIDMTTPTPTQSLYSNLEYKTIFNEDRVTPIRTTYTYYAPLPNPLQFEYLSNNFVIKDPVTQDTLKYLPEWGKADLTFEIDASTEYTYYWIRNAGHDVDYNDPSEAIEGKEELGDGVFGYMIYDIPKGMGGYKINLPTKPDGSYNIDEIVQVDGRSFSKWLDNPNTKNEIEIWEDPFMYRIYIPQLLIPPALDDDNFDGIDDWIDDRGDRFCSSTGFHHDGFMLDDGEDWLDYPEEPFQDDIYGMVDSGWYHGADGTYGDDFFENLGKTHFTINAEYEGQGREGPIDISKGGWLVVEEIFGGSPWVIFSHVLSGYAMGVDFAVESSPNPSMVKFGEDTTYIKHKITDKNEPHDFDINFDPYHVSFGYGEMTVTTYVGGRDPCNLLSPAINMPAIVDPSVDHKTIRLVPAADPDNPDLTGYPRDVSGTFVEVRIEVMNGTDDNWINTTINPIISSKNGNTKVEMAYVAYPRPLVPSKVDPQTGEVIHSGDEIGSFTAGWRFNQPEGEVLVKMGNTLNLLQPSRRAYFIFLINIDESLEDGIYEIAFSMSGTRKHYDEMSNKKKKDGLLSSSISMDIPSAKFSKTVKNGSGSVLEYQQLVIGSGSLNDLDVHTSDYFTGLENAKWSQQNVNHTDFDNMPNTLSSTYDPASGVETIDLSPFDEFPTTDLSEFYILEQGHVDSYYAGDNVTISTEEVLSYSGNSGTFTCKDDQVVVTPIGPKMKAFRQIFAVNGKLMREGNRLQWDSNEELDIQTLVEVTNFGNDIAESTELTIHPGEKFEAVLDKLPAGCYMSDGSIKAVLGSALPGESKKLFIHFTGESTACDSVYDNVTEITSIDLFYKGSAIPETFIYEDTTDLDFPVPDFNMISLTSNVGAADYGEVVTLAARFENGLIASENVWLRIFAVLNEEDTVLVSQDEVDSFGVSEQKEIIVHYTIPSDINNLKFFASIDDGNQISEFCENNNELQATMALDVPISVDAGQDIVMCPDSCITFNPEITGGIQPYTVKWRPLDWLDDPTVMNPTFCHDRPGVYEYILEVIDANNFVRAEDTVQIRIRDIPIIASSDDLIDFGQLDACTSSKTKVFELFNTGTEDVYIDSINIGAGFYLEKPGLPFELKIGESTSLQVKFTPLKEGIDSCKLEIFGGPCELYHTVSMQGEKLKLLVSLKPSVVNFGSSVCLPAFSDTTITIYNDGTDNISLGFLSDMLEEPFALVSPNEETIIAPGQNVAAVISYEPQEMGVYQSQLNIPYNAGVCVDTVRIPLYAEHGEAVLGTNISSIDFPSLLGCESTRDTVINIRNNGNVEMQVTAIEPNDVFESVLPVIVPPGAAGQIKLYFTPLQSGDYDGSLTISYEPCGKSETIRIHGSKQGISFAVTDSVDLGELIYCENQSLTSNFTIVNNSDGGIAGSVKFVSVQGYFSCDLVNDTPLPNGNEQEFSVSFNPSESLEDGEHLGKIDMILSPCDIKKTVYIRAVKKDISIEGPVEIADFGMHYEGEFSEQEFVFTNTGTAPLTIDNVVAPEKPFEILSIQPALPALLEPGEDITIAVVYMAKTKGTQQASITVESSDPCTLALSAEMQGSTRMVARLDVAIGNDSAAVGEYIKIPLMLTSSQNLKESGIESFSARISLNKSVLKPVGKTKDGILEGRNRVIELENIKVDITEGVLAELEFLAVLGNTACTPITIDSIVWHGGNYQCETADGQFCLANLCTEGGVRLFDGDINIQLVECTPNPAKDMIDVDFSVFEHAQTSLYIVDIMGNKVDVIFDKVAEAGRYRLKHDISKLESGSYMMVLETPSHMLSKRLSIVR